MKNAPETERPSIEIWFEFGSNYSYLSVMRIEALAQKHNIQIVWKPFLLGPIFKSLGWESSPFVVQTSWGKYVWKDMKRQCQKYNLPWKQPTRFPRAAILPMRVAVYAREKPWMAEFCRTIMQYNFVNDVEINEKEIVSNALTSLGLPATRILAEAQSEQNKPLLRQFTEEAQQREIFGAPTFFVGDEMFWGNDRLDDAIDFAAVSDDQKR